jgi:hypothetical protein
LDAAGCGPGACLRAKETFGMSSQQASDASSAGPGAPPPGIAGYSHDMLQGLVDQAAWAHVYAVPTPGESGAIRAPGHADQVIGFRIGEALHRFDIDLQPITAAAGVRAANSVGQAGGRLDLRWMMIPFDYVARPDREPPATALDLRQTQRFAMQEGTFTFGDGDGFRSFGTGRTFPTMAGGRLQVVVSAVGNILEGFGKFKGVQGNYTLCGEITADHAFLGHIMIRLVDPDGRLRTREPLPEIVEALDPEPGVTFLTWIAQKSKGPDQENYFSFTPGGQVRGANIPVAIWRPHVDFASDGATGFRAAELAIGQEVAREVGFGRETRPRTADNGTGLNPFQFEGVSEYTFYDAAGQPVGACTAVFLEGRSIAMELPGAPGAPALRFGYFGAFVGGKGCFEGVRGMLYGAAGSVFAPPPADHVITNLYVARIQDPARQFRAR